VYAEPLYVAALTMNDGKKHNVVFLATESDWVYAYDADSSFCQQLWKKSMLGVSETTVPPADTGETGDLTPRSGSLRHPSSMSIQGSFMFAPSPRTPAVSIFTVCML
jgi:hypothetical protein